jgi:hypothetical protein
MLRLAQSCFCCTASAPLLLQLHAPSAASFQVVVQTSSAAAVVLLRRGRSRVLRSCEGLAQPGQPWTAADGQPGGPDTLVAAAFDPARSFRVFGVTAGGDLVALTVPSGTAAHQCKVSACACGALCSTGGPGGVSVPSVLMRAA